MLTDAKSGLLYREGTLDQYIIREQEREYGLLGITEADVVIDIGGNIGAFACGPAKRGVVYSYEPEPENFHVMEAQAAAGLGPEHWYRTQAAVTNVTGTAPMWVNGKKNKGTHTLKPTRGRKEIQVPTVAFAEVLARGNVLKVDIEGWEYELDWTVLAGSDIERLAIELHLQKPAQRLAAHALQDLILAAGFVALRAPKLDGGHWHYTGIWRR